MRTLLLNLLLLPALAHAQVSETTFEGLPARLLASERIEVLFLPQGGAFSSILLQDDPGRMNPLWNPLRMARESGEAPRRPTSIGHFVCVDGFGPASPEESGAGLPSHGEANKLPWQMLSATKTDGVLTVRYQVRLPIVQEVLTRTIRIADGENIVYIENDLESLLAFDRPISWAEHATIGAPFLAPEKTVVDASVGQCRTRAYNASEPRNQRRSLVSDADFPWPVAPTVKGGKVDLRGVPPKPDSMDHTGCQMDPRRQLVYATALRPDLGLLLGYVWRRQEFPWLQDWMNYPANLRLARGLEFSTQPYDIPRRQAVDMHAMFGTPTFRWLPAKSRIAAHFLMFWTRVPDGFRKVDDVTLSAGQLTIIDRTAGKTLVLPARLPL